MFNLENKVCLITGSYKGIGKAIALALGKAGGKVVINGRNEAEVETAAKEIRESGIESFAAPFDVTDEDQVKENIELIEKTAGPLDVLVNNAGMTIRGKAEEFTADEWDRLMDLNLKAAFMVSRETAKRMIERKNGSIIMVGSLMCEASRPGTMLYTASKGGLKMMMKSMALEWGPHNIRVNGIGPGYIETEMTETLVKDPEFDAWVKKKTPAGRWGKPEDLGGAAVFLASQASEFVNGQMIYIDGGWLAGL